MAGAAKAKAGMASANAVNVLLRVVIILILLLRGCSIDAFTNTPTFLNDTQPVIQNCILATNRVILFVKTTCATGLAPQSQRT